MNLTEIIEQLESCKYECEGGSLEMNIAWQELKHRTNLVQIAVDDYDEWFRHNDISKILENSRRYKDALETLWLGEMT